MSFSLLFILYPVFFEQNITLCFPKWKAERLFYPAIRQLSGSYPAGRKSNLSCLSEPRKRKSPDGLNSVFRPALLLCPADDLLINRQHQRLAADLFQFIHRKPGHPAVLIRLDPQRLILRCNQQIGDREMQVRADILSPLPMAIDRQEIQTDDPPRLRVQLGQAGFLRASRSATAKKSGSPSQCPPLQLQLS